MRIAKDISPLEKLDYLDSESMVSDRVKLLLEQYLPEQEWEPCIFVDPSRQAEKTFWFLPPLARSYTPDRIAYDKNGNLLSIHIKEEDFAKKSPGIFHIAGPKGRSFLAVHLSIAESILRRGYLGLELIRLADEKDETIHSPV